jgi:hypothetical protein
MRRREMMVPHPGDRRYIRRDQWGQFTSYQVNVTRALVADRRQHALHTVPPGYGDQGDQWRQPWSGHGLMRHADEEIPRPSYATLAVGQDGSVTALFTDLTTGCQARWCGMIDDTGWVHMADPDRGPFPITACGRAAVDQAGALIVGLAAGGAGIIPGTARFTLWPHS